MLGPRDLPHGSHSDASHTDSRAQIPPPPPPPPRPCALPHSGQLSAAGREHYSVIYIQREKLNMTKLFGVSSVFLPPQGETNSRQGFTDLLAQKSLASHHRTTIFKRVARVASSIIFTRAVAGALAMGRSRLLIGCG
jgi:hypothetical protein